MKTERLVTITFKLPQSQRDYLHQRAKKEDLNVSQALRRMIREDKSRNEKS